MLIKEIFFGGKLERASIYFTVALSVETKQERPGHLLHKLSRTSDSCKYGIR